MSTIVGHKSEFAIEYRLNKISPYIMGNVCIWLDGKCIGYLLEEVVLSIFQTAINQLENKLNQLENPKFNNISFLEIFEMISSGKIENGKHFLSLGESFDDFIIYVYRIDDKLNFIWKLCDEPFYSYPNYNKEINYKSISIEGFLECVEKFNKKLNF